MSKEIIKKAGREFEKETLPDGTVNVRMLPKDEKKKSDSQDMVAGGEKK